MQRTEIISEKRPQRAIRVIPIEPSLRNKRWIVVSGIIVLLLYIINAYSTFNTAIWGHACLDVWGFYYIVISAIAIVPSTAKKSLDQRRQQAARYNMTLGVPAQTTGQPQSDALGLPPTFIIRLQRSWFYTCVTAIIHSLILSVIWIVVYSYWQAAPQGVQQGVPLALTILQNGLNIAILFLAAASSFSTLVFSPRQQLSATSDGLIYRRGLRTRSIPWQEARLFALIGQANTREQEPLFYYELASKDTSIRWPSTSKRAKEKAFVNISLAMSPLARPTSTAEIPQQVQFLNIIIAERTGLPLYDLR
jgi:hypothetical protein